MKIWFTRKGSTKCIMRLCPCRRAASRYSGTGPAATAAPVLACPRRVLCPQLRARAAVNIRAAQIYRNISAVKRSIGSTTGCTIMEKAPTRAFSWLKAPTRAFRFKTLLRHYAKRELTPRSLNMKLGPRRNYHKGRAAIRHYANQTARPL